MSNIVERVLSWFATNKKMKQEDEMLYWGEIIGKRFDTYPQMCGARDKFLREHPKTNNNDLNQALGMFQNFSQNWSKQNKVGADDSNK